MFSPQDILDVQLLSVRDIWGYWSQHPVKAAVTRAVVFCEAVVHPYAIDMATALSQSHPVCFYHWKGVDIITKTLEGCFPTFTVLLYPKVTSLCKDPAGATYECMGSRIVSVTSWREAGGNTRQWSTLRYLEFVCTYIADVRRGSI